jgi:hypothetical protein
MRTHHAYYIEDSLHKREEYQRQSREREQFLDNDPNFTARYYDKFGIDEARTLIELSNLKNTGERALFFIATPAMTSEAQQALLKLFEEPQSGTTFVLLVPHGVIIATLRSRMLKYQYTISDSLERSDAKEFLASTYKKRSDWIATILKDEDAARERVRGFFDELERELYPRMSGSREVRDALGELQHFRQYLSDRSPSLKMILEHFAATLPTL